jgi:hypothetical protein
MDNGSSVTAPQSVAEVEELIKRFYNPKPGDRHKALDDQLIQLQRSQDAWKLADELMASDHAAVRLYAVNTFIVKLNNDGSVSDPEMSPW